MTDLEFKIIRDGPKRIDGDIVWTEDEDHSPVLEFRATIISDVATGLDIRGSFNVAVGKLSYVLLHRGTGRIYALDLGVGHHNSSCQDIGEVHKHSWTEGNRDKDAYVPDDIAATVENPVAVWRQFCNEARIVHTGTMIPPPLEQLEFPL